MGAVTLAVTLCVLATAALPSASATECTVVVTLLTGQKLYYHLPPGVPPSTLKLPPGVRQHHGNVSEGHHADDDLHPAAANDDHEASADEEELAAS